jgi:MFS family permease
MNLTLLILIHIAMGVSTAGINLSLTNIGLKLAPKNESIIYLATKNIGTAIFSSLGPLLGGYLADYFTKRSLIVNAEWVGPRFTKILHLVSLHEWNFLFLIGGFLAVVALQFLFTVKETGEVEKDEVRRIMRSSLRNNLKDYFVIGQLISLQEQLWRFVRKKTLSNPGTK